MDGDDAETYLVCLTCDPGVEVCCGHHLAPHDADGCHELVAKAKCACTRRSAAVPDPRFRDQLAEDVHQALYDLMVDHPMWIDGQGRRLDYSPEREIRIGDFLDAATAAVVARVQAAAGQRAAEELDAVAEELLGFGDTAPSKQQVHLAAWLQATADNFRAAALAQPAPAAPTGEQP